MKKCLQCGELKNLNEYHLDKSRKTGLRERCKDCRCKHKKTIKKNCLSCEKEFIAEGRGKAKKYCSLICQRVFIRFGISGSDYKNLLYIQKNKCAICGQSETSIDKRTGKEYNLAIDHCHESGVVRALLCTKCNNGLGSFKEDVGLLNKAIEYIEKYRYLKK